MKRAYLILFSLMIGTSLIVASIIFLISNNFKEQKQKEIDDENAIIAKINDEYKKFNDNLELFKDKHNDFLTYVDSKTSFFADIPKNYSDIEKVYNEYSEYLKQMDKDDNYLYDNCKGKFYSDKDVNVSCTSYLRNMESSINTFIQDFIYLNHKIDSYNEWIIEENKSVLVTTKYKSLDKFKSDYNDYVDLDGDNVKSGVNAD